jgi:hypothetical protein
MTATAVSAGTRARGWMLKGLFGLQVIAGLVGVLVPFGFDHPSSWGLDFGHLLLLAALYLVALLAGMALAVKLRRYGILVGQLALLAALTWLVMSGALGS